MFEDSLMESGNKIETKSKYWSLAALLFDGLLLLALIAWPLLHPQALPTQVMAPLMVAPPSPPTLPPAATTPRVLVKSELLSRELQAPSRILKEILMAKEAGPAMEPMRSMEGVADGPAGGIGTVLGNTGTEPARVVKPLSPTRFIISSGVMAGNLIEKTMPQYPAIAKAARIQGTVVLQATISTTGVIENLRVISGPPMLQQAALDAVRSWRYQPYLLNGYPVEVETTINVVFNLGE